MIEYCIHLVVRAKITGPMYFQDESVRLLRHPSKSQTKTKRLDQKVDEGEGNPIEAISIVCSPFAGFPDSIGFYR